MIHAGLGQYLAFGQSNGLQIADFDYSNCSQQFGHDIAHAGSFKSPVNAILNDPKCQKGGFWPLS